jgi:hypothetical protein
MLRQSPQSSAVHNAHRDPSRWPERYGAYKPQILTAGHRALVWFKLRDSLGKCQGSAPGSGYSHDECPRMCSGQAHRYCPLIAPVTKESHGAARGKANGHEGQAVQNSSLEPYETDRSIPQRNGFNIVPR